MRQRRCRAYSQDDGASRDSTTFMLSFELLASGWLVEGELSGRTDWSRAVPRGLGTVPRSGSGVVSSSILSSLPSSPTPPPIMATDQQTGPGLCLRIVPGPSSGSSSSSLSTTQTAAPEHAGIHDTLRYGTRSLAFDTAGADDGAARHPVQARLEGWEETRDTLKTTLQRNMYGLGAPLRMSMERRAVEWVSSAKGLAPASHLDCDTIKHTR